MTYFWAKTTLEGKPSISVYDHMINVGCVARCIAEDMQEILKRFHLRSTEVGALAALHDIGKISPGFQRKCEAWLEENGLTKIARNGCWDTAMESDHGKVSHAEIQAFLNNSGLDRKTAKFVSTVLGAHHGSLDSPPNCRGYCPQKAISETQSRIDWDTKRRMNAQKIWEQFIEGNPTFTLSDTSPALWWLAGLTSVADWIGSDERFFSPEQLTGDKDVLSLARNALNSIGFVRPDIKENLSFKSLFGFPPNDMQKKTFDLITGPGVYVIEAPMGMGKTEASLWTAYKLMSDRKASGIYFALPTQATSNRMHIRMNKFVQNIISGHSSASRLIHRNSWLMDQSAALSPVSTCDDSASDDARTGRDWFASAKRALIAPFGVGTIDQALLGVVAAKHFFVRHFALAGKVVILDEVHSYDLYTGTLIYKLITTLEGLGCTVIVLSATLTGKRRNQIVSAPMDSTNDAELPYPLITGRMEGLPVEPAAAIPPESRTIKIDFVSEDKAEEEAVKLARNGGAVLWICNTINVAQKQYRNFIKFADKSFHIGLLHSRFPYWRREELESEWMERFGKDSKTRCGSILVSTQVVEQSVDLDADLLITELAPTDMLLQRLGRLWRHEREQRPVDAARFYIIKEEKSLEEFRSMEPKAIVDSLGGKAHVYDAFVLLRTLQLWESYPNVVIPLQIRELVEATYSVRDDDPKSWEKLFDERFVRNSNERFKAVMNSNYWQPQLPDEEGVQTRLNETPTVLVVLCRSINKQEAVFIDNTSKELGGDVFLLSTAQAIHKNLVRVPRYCFDHVESCIAFTFKKKNSLKSKNRPDHVEHYIHGEHSVGIVAESGDVEVKGLKNGYRLFYSDDLGLVIEKISQ